LTYDSSREILRLAQAHLQSKAPVGPPASS
jgi:hypothetical protein